MTDRKRRLVHAMLIAMNAGTFGAIVGIAIGEYKPEPTVKCRSVTGSMQGLSSVRAHAVGREAVRGAIGDAGR